MSQTVWQGFAQDESGNVLENASIEVRDVSDNSLATLFEDENGSTPLSNPFTTGSDGFIQFYTEVTKIKITATKGFDVVTFKDILLPGTLSTQDSDSISITGGSISDSVISESNVTQHEAALSITGSQISDYDLAAIDTRVNELDAAIILMGTFAPSGGSFPGGGTAQAGESWIASDSGTIDGMAITTDDRVIAITDNASTSSAADWHKADYTDLVQSVAGKTGSVVLAASDIASGTFANARIAQSNVTQHEGALTITESQISDLDHTDSNAVHDNVSGEIAAITEKASPVSADLVIIEDSEASNAKKRVQVSNLRASGEVTKVGTPADNQVAVWTGDGTIEGTSGLTWDGSTLVSAASNVTWSNNPTHSGDHTFSGSVTAGALKTEINGPGTHLTLSRTGANASDYVITNGGAILDHDYTSSSQAWSLSGAEKLKLDGTGLTVTDDLKFNAPDDTSRSATALLESNLTVQVPTDYSTIQAALDELGQMRVKQGVTITINIETGHALTAGFRIDNVDYGHFKITSTDATVSLAAGFTVVSSTDLDDSHTARASEVAFIGVNSRMPQFNIKVDTAGVSLKHGMEVRNNSSIIVGKGAGVLNVETGTGAEDNDFNLLVADQSDCKGRQSIWTGAGGRNIQVTQTSRGTFQNATITGSQIWDNLDVSRGSVVHCKDADLTGAARSGLRVRRSFVSAQGVDVSNAGGTGVHASITSWVGMKDATFNSVTGTEVHVAHGSFINISEATKGGSALTASDTNQASLNTLTGDGAITQ